MKTIADNTLLTAQAAVNRYPVAEVIARRTGISFSPNDAPTDIAPHPYNATYPWFDGYDDVDSETIPYDGATDGQFGMQVGVQVSIDGNNLVVRDDYPDFLLTNAYYWERISIDASVGCSPGALSTGSKQFRIFYVGVVSSQRLLVYRDQNRNVSFNWSSPTPLVGPNFHSGVGNGWYTGVAPVTSTEVYVATVPYGKNYVEIYYINDSGYGVCPRRFYGTSEFPITAEDAGAVHFFDAFRLNGVDYIVLANRKRKTTFVMTHKDGIWGDPRPIVPPDYSGFVGYRVTVTPTFDEDGALTKEIAFLTGRIYRDNADGYDTAFDVFLRSADGLNWTLLDRESFIDTKECHGKLLVVGDTIYCSSIAYRKSSPACWTIGVDNAALKADLTSDLLSFNATYPGTDSAPQASISLANGDNQYHLNGLVRPGTDLWIRAGYRVAGVDHLSPVLRCDIESAQRSVQAGGLTFSVSALDKMLKRFKNWASPFYIDMRSQLKKHDIMENLGGMYSYGGVTWSERTDNLLNETAIFENQSDGDTSLPAGWTAYNDGGTIGYLVVNNIEESCGTAESLRAVRITRTGGTVGGYFGLQLTTPPSFDAGETFEISVDARVLSPENGKVYLEASGNFGVDGVAKVATAEISDTGGYQNLTLVISNDSKVDISNLVIRVYALPGSEGGSFGLDNVSIIGDADNYVSMKDHTDERIMFATDPAEAVDFDVRGLFQNHVSSRYEDVMSGGDWIYWGLVGHGVDEKNLMCARVYLNNASDGENVSIWKRRNNSYTQVGSKGSLATNSNDFYWVRFTGIGGVYNVYVVAAASESAQPGYWGSPVATYTWDDADDQPCPSKSGGGKVGIVARIKPPQFHIYAVDAHSLILPLRYDNDGDWNNLPGIYKNDVYLSMDPTRVVDVIVDDEIMTVDKRRDVFLNGDTTPSPSAGGVSTYLTASLSAGATSMSLNDFPTNVAYGNVYALIVGGGKEEIVQITSYAKTCNITRAVGNNGYTAQSFAAGSRVYTRYASGAGYHTGSVTQQSSWTGLGGDYISSFNIPKTNSGTAIALTGDGYYGNGSEPHVILWQWFNGDTRWGWRGNSAKMWNSVDKVMLHIPSHPGPAPNYTPTYYSNGELAGYAMVVVSGVGNTKSWQIHTNENPYDSDSGKITPVYCGRDGHEYELWENWGAGEGSTPEEYFGRGHPCYYLDLADGIAEKALESSTDYITEVRVVPGLRVSRGTTGRKIVPHADGSICQYYTDDSIRLYTFEAYDFQHDWNTEDLIRKVVTATGVLNVEFGSLYEPAGYTTVIGPGGSSATISDTGMEMRDFDVSFTTTDPGGVVKKMLVFNAKSDLSEYRFLRFYNSKISLGNVVGGVTTIVQEVAAPASTGNALYLRVIANAGFVTVYVNGSIAANFYDNTLQEAEATWAHKLGFGVLGSGAVVISEVRIPELFEWRDAIWVDNDADGASALQNIIGDRYIRYLSRGGEAIKFSAFDDRETVDTYADAIYNDDAAPEEAQAVSYIRVYAAEIIEAYDTELIDRYGFIFKALQMPRASNTQAKKMIDRTFRMAKQNAIRRSLSMPPDLRIEPEDRLDVSYDAAGSLAQAEGLDGTDASEPLIANDVSFEFSPANFVMTIGARRWVA